MDLRIGLGNSEVRIHLWQVAALVVFTWLLFTFGDGALNAFVDGLSGHPPHR